MPFAGLFGVSFRNPGFVIGKTGPEWLIRSNLQNFLKNMLQDQAIRKGAFTRKDGRLAGELLVDLKSESQAGPKEMDTFIRGMIETLGRRETRRLF